MSFFRPLNSRQGRAWSSAGDSRNRRHRSSRPPVEVGGEAVDQLQALGTGGLPSRLAEDRRQRLVNPRQMRLAGEEAASQEQAREEREEGRGAGICADASMEGHCLHCRSWLHTHIRRPGGAPACRMPTLRTFGASVIFRLDDRRRTC